MSTLLATLALTVLQSPAAPVQRPVERPAIPVALLQEPRGDDPEGTLPEPDPRAPALRFAVALDDLGWEGGVPELERRLTGRRLQAWPQPRVRVEEGRAYLGWTWLPPFSDQDVRLGDLRVGFEVPEGSRVLHGVLEWPGESPQRYPFVLSVEELPGDDPDAQLDFLEARYLHAAWRHALGIPGGAWWRHRVARDGERLEAAGRRPPFDPEGRIVPAGGARPELQDTYDLFTGGRALAENLDLDAVLEPVGDDGDWVVVESLSGIRVPAFDWDPLVRDLEVEPLRLTRAVPADQHVVLFPDLAAAERVLAELERGGTPVLELFEARAEDLGLRVRYERQLALELDAGLRALAARLAGRVAITGSDPYLRTGTDLAVLFEVPDGAAAFETWMRARHAQVAAAEGLELAELPLATGVASVLRSRDRARSSYVLRVDDLLVVANSAELLRRIDGTLIGAVPSLAGLEELRFFQDRYLGDEGPEPDAFLVIPDAAIRRWCGARWRIGAARRTRAAALLAEAEAALLDEHDARARPVVDDVRLPGGDRLRREVFHDGRLGVRSETYGTTEYQVPIRELDLDRVTEREAQAYREWRARYDRRWTRFYDPVAAGLWVTPEALELDLTVLPLSERSDYDVWRDLTAGGRLRPRSGEPRAEALLSVALGVDPERGQGMSFGSLVQGLGLPLGNPLGWMDGSIVLHLEPSPFWAEALASGDLEGHVSAHLSTLPVTFRLDSHDPLGLTAFLGALRSWISGAAPDLLEWVTVETEHGSYVRVAPRQRLGLTEDEPVLAYAALPDAWVVGLSEAAILGVLERRARAARGEATAPGPDWLGENLGLSLGRDARELLVGWWRATWADELQRRSWDTLEVLDELRSEGFEDPAAVLGERFGAVPLCPGGGAFERDPDSGRFRSSVFGSPLEPRAELELPPGLAQLVEAQLGVTFEHGGLRARVRLVRSAH